MSSGTIRDYSNLQWDGVIDLAGGLTAGVVGFRAADFDSTTTAAVDSISIKTYRTKVPRTGPVIKFNGLNNSSDPRNLGVSGTPFTIEFYISWPAIVAQQEYLFGLQSGINYLVRNGSNQFVLGSITTTAGLVAANTLCHIAITRNSSNLVTLWIDGVSRGTYTDASNYSSSTTYYWGDYVSAGQGPTANFSAARITAGVCRYTAGFTPTYATWPTTTGGDANWNSVVMLWRGNERTSLDGGSAIDVPDSSSVFTPIVGVQPDIPLAEGPIDPYDTGIYRVYGTTKILGTPNAPVSRRVLLMNEESKRVIRSQWSDPITGAYSFDSIRYDPVAVAPKYLVITEDWQHNYRAVIADNLTPEAM